MKNILDPTPLRPYARSALNYLKLTAGWVVALSVAWGALWIANKYTPPQHNPLAPLDLNDPIGMATYRKFTALRNDREACFKALDQSGIGYTPLEDRSTGEQCGFYDALTLDRSLTPYSATLSMTCAQTAALYVWEAQVARPLAEELLGSPIATIHTFGAYSCRTIAGSRRWSQHSKANAVDISGFTLEDGRRINVKTHWDVEGPEGEFLEAVHDGACEVFSISLGPDYNAAHADHFHFDMGPGWLCR